MVWSSNNLIEDMGTPSEYARMQVSQYDRSASYAQVRPGAISNEHVVGWFDLHNAWPDHHEYLFKHSKLPVDTSSLVTLDFACGPGRNILLYKDRFQRIDGVDISQVNLENARVYTSGGVVPIKPNLYHCNGLDLANIPSNTYDVVFSTIALQHICCHTIRLNYIREFNRVLKKGGFICVQMGYGAPYPQGTNAIGYHENNYTAQATNSGCDTRIEDVKDVEQDLVETGFGDFEYNIRPSGPGDTQHPNWIYWSATKVK